MSVRFGALAAPEITAVEKTLDADEFLPSGYWRPLVTEVRDLLAPENRYSLMRCPQEGRESLPPAPPFPADTILLLCT